MREPSQIGDARRQGARLAAELGFDEVASGRLALVVTELATNLVRHAHEGSLLMARYDGDAEGEPAIELISLDRGPGMRDVEHSMTDGVSTFGSSGTGLGAVRRLSNQFLIFSKPDAGTVIVCRIAADSARGAFAAADADGISFGAVCLAAPREVVSGDAWAWQRSADGVRLMVADGLGHGPDAATAADEAVRVFRAAPSATPGELLETMHGVLRGTRGAAVSAILVDLGTRDVTFCGAGNVSARLISGVQDRSLMSQHGTLGLQIRRLQEVRYEWPAHGVLVMHSDGIATRWDLRGAPEVLGCDAIVIAVWLLREHLRGPDDATVVVLRLG
jgi:anti-sigma regulatory factor (Ser/Thr protein kinase)